MDQLSAISLISSVSTQPESGTQAIVILTQLCSEEAEVLFVFQPVAEDTADAVILVIETGVCHNGGGCILTISCTT